MPVLGNNGPVSSVDKRLSRENARGLNAPALDRRKWHTPLCTVIVPHRNYSRLVEDCLLSLLDQTYANWECVVVDDNSSEDERNRLIDIINRLPEPRIRLIQQTEQLGQVATFFAGLAESSGEFVAPLDPDDRLHQTYLEHMVRAHLNESMFCPIVSCEQKLLRIGGGLIAGTYKGTLRWNKGVKLEYPVRLTIDAPDDDTLLYFPSLERGWLWTATSSLMVRRSAVRLLVPNKLLGYNSLDSYLTFGAHFLGGTLCLEKALVYRGLHGANDYLGEHLFCVSHRQTRDGAPERTPECMRDAVEALFHNGVRRFITDERLSKLLRQHFDAEQMTLLGKACPQALELWLAHAAKKPSKPSILRRLLGW